MIILRDRIIVDGLVSEDPDNIQILNSLLQTLQKWHDGEPPPVPHLHVTSKRDWGDTINSMERSYSENDIYHYLAFPTKYRLHETLLQNRRLSNQSMYDNVTALPTPSRLLVCSGPALVYGPN